jgi:hypothetical protein
MNSTIVHTHYIKSGQRRRDKNRNSSGLLAAYGSSPGLEWMRAAACGGSPRSGVDVGGAAAGGTAHIHSRTPSELPEAVRSQTEGRPDQLPKILEI